MENILKKYWGYNFFRPLQREIIESALNKKDTLALLPTGGGKSICFQIPSLKSEGIALVISPLIALMKDQVENLKARGIKALAIYSGLSFNQINIALDNAIYGEYKFLYLSPERLKSAIFLDKLQYMNVNYIVVDEAHCISQWGYDFRPDYLDIAKIREILPEVPVIALTATATISVAQDIMQKLNFKDGKLLLGNFERKNLSYIAREVEDKRGHILNICNKIEGSGIIYCRTRKGTQEISNFLKANNFSADFYHAGLSKDDRASKQEHWKSGDIKIIAATNAFGMGIDKPDVRFVIHYDVPSSLEGYFQEAGRAGRDGNKAYTVLLWNKTDIKTLKQINTIAIPKYEYLQELYQEVFLYLQIPYNSGEGMVRKFDIVSFAQYKKQNLNTVFYAIKYLEQEGFWEYTEEVEIKTRIKFKVSRDDLYCVQLNNSKLDNIIKTLLRIYPALFTSNVQIDESLLAKKTLDSVEGVKDKLNSLGKMGIISYYPGFKSSVLILKQNRYSPKDLFISKKEYDNKKERMLGRVNSIISYLNDEDNCRSILLQNYFGAISKEYCGNCDYCIKKKSKDITKEQKELIKEEILRVVKNNRGLSINNLVEIDIENPTLIKNCTRELIDNGLLKLENNTLFEV